MFMTILLFNFKHDIYAYNELYIKLIFIIPLSKISWLNLSTENGNVCKTESYNNMKLCRIYVGPCVKTNIVLSLFSNDLAVTYEKE